MNKSRRRKNAPGLSWLMLHIKIIASCKHWWRRLAERKTWLIAILESRIKWLTRTQYIPENGIDGSSELLHNVSLIMLSSEQCSSPWTPYRSRRLLRQIFPSPPILQGSWRGCIELQLTKSLMHETLHQRRMYECEHAAGTQRIGNRILATACQEKD